MRETFVAVVVSNLPIVYQGFRRMMTRGGSHGGTGASRQSAGSSNIFSRLRNRLSGSSYSDYKHRYKRSKDSQLSQQGEGPQASLNMHPLSSTYPHLHHGGDANNPTTPEGDEHTPTDEIMVGYKSDFGEPFGASYWKQQHRHEPNNSHEEESVEPVHILSPNKAYLRN